MCLIWESRSRYWISRDLLRLSGLQEGRDIDIDFIGLQKGEKMNEELFYETERPERSRHEKILICRNGFDSKTAVTTLYAKMHRVDLLVKAAHAGDLGLICRTLVDLVPQYRDYEIASAESDKPEDKRGLVIPMQRDLFDAPARPARCRAIIKLDATGLHLTFRMSTRGNRLICLKLTRTRVTTQMLKLLVLSHHSVFPSSTDLVRLDLSCQRRDGETGRSLYGNSQP